MTLVEGANGAGKTNFYRALQLIAEASHGRFLRRFAEEGGLEPVSFAGDSTFRTSLRFEFTTEYDDLSLRCEIGCAPRNPDVKDERGKSMWDFDPEF